MTPEILPPPWTIQPDGPQAEISGVEDGFYVCVARLVPYKNVEAVVKAFAGLPGERLVVAGAGPEEERLRTLASPNVRLVGNANDAQLRWLYARCAATVSAAYEDFGLTPLEAAAFGKPSAVLRYGGFLDTVREGVTGVFFDRPEPALIRDAIHRLASSRFREETLRMHASLFSEAEFIARLKLAALDEFPQAPSSRVGYWPKAEAL